MFVLMCIYPWNEIVTTSSPFVQVFNGIGVKFAAGIINFVVLTAALSACNSAILVQVELYLFCHIVVMHLNLLVKLIIGVYRLNHCCFLQVHYF